MEKIIFGTAAIALALWLVFMVSLPIVWLMIRLIPWGLPTQRARKVQVHWRKVSVLRLKRS